MAFADFSITKAYAALMTALNAQLTAVGKLFKDQATGDFTDQIRYNSSAKRLEYWTGSAWAALDVTGESVGTASSASSASSATNATNATNATGTGSAVFARYENGLRVIRGSFSSNGTGTPTVNSGSGFTISRASAGTYYISITNAFSNRFSVLCSPYINGTYPISAEYSHNSLAIVTMRLSVGGSLSDIAGVPIDFFIVGPN